MAIKISLVLVVMFINGVVNPKSGTGTSQLAAPIKEGFNAVGYLRCHCVPAMKPILLALLILLDGAAGADPIGVDGGLIQGTIEHSLSVYRDIPCATPPIGDLRWRAPWPASKWRRILAAEQFGRACIQLNPGSASFPALGEDCLYLNVWRPAKSAKCGLPFGVRIHGAIAQNDGSFGPVCSGRESGENVKSPADAEQADKLWAQKAGASGVADLPKLPSGKLLIEGPGGGVTWPVMDGWIIPGGQYKLYQAGRYNDTPILVGYNSGEGATFRETRTPQAYVESVRRRYGQFAEKLLALWSNFAKTGDPNGAGLPNWPAYSNAKPQVMHFLAETARVGPVVNEEGLKALEAYFE
jgi:carboxylesterase type B